MAFSNGAAVAYRNIAYFSALYNVYSFELPDKWTKLQQCPYNSFGLAVINEQLTTIGGYVGESWETTNILLSLKHGQSVSEWEQFLPPMPTARVCPASVTTPTHLIVVKGRTSLLNDSLSTVEVMDIETLQWSTASGLPQALGFPKMTLCDEHLYLTLNNTLFFCSIEKLLQSLKEPVSTDKINGGSLWTRLADISSNKPLSTDSSNGGSVWTRLTDIPGHYTSSLVTLGGCVLATASGRQTGAIYCYNKATNSWSITGKMPTPRSDFLTAVLSTNKLVVVGGNITSFNRCTYTEIGEVVPE